jgi:uncharacterized protein YjiS (DUF1127 family)
MTRLPSPYPHQVVANWITANDGHALTDSIERAAANDGHALTDSIERAAANDGHALTDSIERALVDVTWDDRPSPLDYDVCTRRARKMQAEAIAAAGHTIGTAIGNIVSNTIGSFRDYLRTRRQIERLSYLTPRLLDDIGLSHDIQGRVRALQAHRQYRFTFFCGPLGGR